MNYWYWEINGGIRNSQIQEIQTEKINFKGYNLGF